MNRMVGATSELPSEQRPGSANHLNHRICAVICQCLWSDLFMSHPVGDAHFIVTRSASEEIAHLLAFATTLTRYGRPREVSSVLNACLMALSSSASGNCL